MDRTVAAPQRGKVKQRGFRITGTWSRRVYIDSFINVGLKRLN